MIKGKVVVQLLVYNEPVEMIDRLFASLASTDYPRELWEVSVLNNYCKGHDDVEQAVAGRWVEEFRRRGLQIRFAKKDPNLGFAGGHDWLFRRAVSVDPEFVYLLNADATVDPGFLREAVAAAGAFPNAALVQSRIMLEQEPELLNSHGNAMHFLGFGFTLGYRSVPDAEGYPAGKRPLPTFYPSGAGVLARADAVRRVGGLFDPRYFLYHEDSDLGWRALLAGYEVRYASKSVIYHKYEFTKSIRKFYWIERNRYVNLFVFYKFPTLLLIALPALAMELGAFLFSIRSGWWKEKLRVVAFFCRPSTWKWIGERRRLARSIRVRRDRDVLALMVGEISNQEVDSPLLTRVVNPVMRGYLSFLRKVVSW
jgi:GT2 family glycosyltransferase